MLRRIVFVAQSSYTPAPIARLQEPSLGFGFINGAPNIREISKQGHLFAGYLDIGRPIDGRVSYV
jgi:hypothetical protein